ncbi:hypothetical protein TYRP_012775 [Tyrophagus putrescentiae]|nr:hypothetical protein TYRP_012775 [Tyrophagus putrescentiae]
MAVKRAAPRTYNFGLGKRGGGGGGNGAAERSCRQRSNGAAAPSSYYYQSSPGGYVDNYGLQAALYVPESLGIKRSKPQRFSFGLGKRTWALRGEGGEGEVAQEDNTVDAVAAESAEEAAAEADANGRDKRKAERYQFGLGKRSPFAWFTSTSGNGSPKSSRSIDEFKRRYNFGLGK